ncbi:MAG TPA: cupin domain-containing protein [Pseudonocardiaceae bacterium]|nr:cupin domain-containing protein [Pseudonocardiaceae bacterium]
MEDASRSVRDYLRFSRLGRDYDPEGLRERGEGFLLSRDGIDTIFYHSGSAMRFLAYVEFATGQTRGNHYHHSRVEHLCVAKGQLDATYRVAGGSGEWLTVSLTAGDVVRVLPGCVHTYVAREHSVALEFAPQPFDEADTVRP